ncbi:MAG: hypothetical protein IKU06_09370 [Lachnospiraceae bacterium]|nr:hypothetical protein [Lachnospiraceae bacterium]
MTVDEIFSSESEHLYFRLIAARNALNAANDNETRQVLNEILDETLNNISRIGTDEEIAAAEEIVVRKSNKDVKDYLSCQKFSLIASAVAFTAIVVSVLALILIIVGANSASKIKAIITVVLFGGGISAMALMVVSYMKKRMATAKESLKGKTVIGARIDTGVRSTATKTAASYAPVEEPKPVPMAPAAPTYTAPAAPTYTAPATSAVSAPAASAAPTTPTYTAPVANNTAVETQSRPTAGRPATAARPKTEHTAARKQKGPKVVHNYFGILKVLVPLAVVAVLGFFVYTNWDKIHSSIKNIMYNVGLTDPAPKADVERFKELNAKLVEVKNIVYYNEAGRLFEAEKYAEAAELYNKCLTFKDSESKRVEAKNEDYYKKALKESEVSLINTIKILNQISLPYKNAKALLIKYSRYTPYVNYTYENDTDRFAIKDFVFKDYVIYIKEERMGLKKIENLVDREGYEFEVIEQKGDEVIKWYIAEDHVLKVSDEGTKTLKR